MNHFASPGHSRSILPSRCDIFMVTYGGGHADISEAVGAALVDMGVEVSVLALTSGRRPMVETLGTGRVFGALEAVKGLYGAAETMEILGLGRRGAEALKLTSHVWSEEETFAYLGISIWGGISGGCVVALREERLRLLKISGRRALEPPVEFACRLLNSIRPAGVFTTNSPRMEQAFRRAAVQIGIPLGGMIDFLGNTELCRVEANRLFVMSELAAKNLVSQGYDPGCIEITGHPALDNIARMAAPPPAPGAVNGHIRNDVAMSDSGPMRVLVATQPTPSRPAFLAAVARVADGIAALCEKETAAGPGKGIRSIEFLVTPHPSDDREAWRAVGKVLKGTRLRRARFGFRTREYFQWADLLVTEYSSTILEAVAAGVMPIAVNCVPASTPRQYHALKDWDSVICCGIDDLAVLLKSIAAEGLPSGTALAVSGFLRDGRSARRIAASMLSLSGVPERSLAR